MRKALLLTGASAACAGVRAAGWWWLGADSAGFAVLVVWVPMTWLCTVSRVVRPRLPDACPRLRPFELDGRVYERLGVRTFKRLLRRGPLAVFNPDLHLPEDRSPAGLAHLDRRMRDAEAAHALLFVGTFGVIAHAVVQGWWAAAALTLLFDVVMNGYPVLLQRYNRALLQRRYGPFAEA